MAGPQRVDGAHVRGFGARRVLRAARPGGSVRQLPYRRAEGSAGADVGLTTVLVLAVDTATPAITAGLVAVGDGPPRLLAERVTVDAKAHGELLTPQILAVLAETGHRLSE